MVQILNDGFSRMNGTTIYRRERRSRVFGKCHEDEGE
jgi:hypothetical protein